MPIGLSAYGLMKDRVTGVMVGAIGAIIGAIGIYDWADLTNKAGQINDSPIIDISVSVGAGLVLTTIAGALLVAAAIGLFRLPKPSPSAAATPDEQFVSGWNWK